MAEATAHLWVGDTPLPAPGDQAVCGYVFGPVFTPAGPTAPHCPWCVTLATPADLEAAKHGR